MALLAGCTSARTTTGPTATTPAGPSGSKLQGIGASLPSVGRLEPSTDLNQFGAMYLTDASAGQCPKRLEDMQDLRRSMGRVYQAIQAGEYVVNWGADPQHAPGGASQTLLAYVKDAPVKGGVALFLDGSVRTVTAAEIKSAPPAR